MLSDYLPILLLIVIATGMVLIILVLSTVLGPQRKNEWKHEPFECGSEPIGSARSRFSVKFYVVALLFIIFDIETVFVVPWAVLYQEMGMAGLIEMTVFLGILTTGLVYVWRKGGLEWH